MSEQVKTEQSDQPIISVKEAVKIAQRELVNLIGQENLPGLLLEEVELTNDGEVWSITFGYDTQRLTDLERQFPSLTVARPRYVRDYKTINIRASDGQFLSMKIRTL